MGGQIVLLVLGFVLTTLLGGSIGYLFQRRTWEANRKESEREAAATLFGELSRAMDRRLYRMWLFHWRLNSGDEASIETVLNDYREVLKEWNDGLNRNLALTYRYFGEDVWRYFDRILYEEFARLGRCLEQRYRERARAGTEASSGTLGGLLKALSDDIYRLNRFLVSLIQHGRVGLYQSRKAWPERPPWEGDLARGTEGPRVAEWQRVLNLVRQDQQDQIEVDGRFGEATRQATIEFQSDNGLEPDGIVGARTRHKMDARLPEFIAPTW
jgi:Putative peptidoglycan binding domain